jgi:hypothetical protein
MSDHLARSSDPLTLLEEDALSLLVLRDGTELYHSYDPGVAPLLELVQWFPGFLSGAVVADRVVGACAARVFEHLRVSRVLGITGSIPAERILHAAAIEHRFRYTVTEIRNQAGTDLCPFEKLAIEHTSAVTLVPSIREKLKELRAAR